MAVAAAAVDVTCSATRPALSGAAATRSRTVVDALKVSEASTVALSMSSLQPSTRLPEITSTTGSAPASSACADTVTVPSAS
ncbi:MAG: hypothetical protein SGJ13_00900 [Actinomycetota bacterium]|nr:hypothetical protein [Actinomycetota bacterium]